MRGEKRVNILRMWRNWQTRRFQVPVGDRMGSNPFIRTKKTRQDDFVLFCFFLFKNTRRDLNG